MIRGERDQPFWGFQRGGKFLHCSSNSVMLPNGKLGFCFLLGDGVLILQPAGFFANLCKKEGKEGRNGGGQAGVGWGLWLGMYVV